jgi:hypothetical protein
MVDTSGFSGHRQGWDFDSLEGADIDDFFDAVEADEMVDAEDHDEALEAWRTDAVDGEEVAAGLTREQLRSAAHELFGRLDEILTQMLRKRRGDANEPIKVPGAMIAGLGCALGLPSFASGSKMAKQLGCTRAGVNIYKVEYAERLGLVSESQARRARSCFFARLRHLRGEQPKNGQEQIHRPMPDKEKPEVRSWLETLTPEEREQARLALKGKTA